MTIEEAIKYAERKNLRIKEWLERHGSYYGDYAIYCSEQEFTSLAIASLRSQQEAEKNDPLTIDEMWKIDGEPVELRIGGGEMTMGNRIRAMSDEELAEFLSVPCTCEVSPVEDGYCDCGNDICIKRLINWLQQPVEM